MNRRAFLSALSGSLLAAPLAGEAQQPLGETLDKQDPLLLLAFVFVVVVLFLLCAGLLMLVFRRSGMLKTDPSLPLAEVFLLKPIADEESTPSDSAQPSGGGDPRSAGPRPHDPAVAPAAGGSGDRVSRQGPGRHA